MAPKDRQRAAARARLQREMAERAAAAQKRRRTQTIVAAGVAALVLLAGVIWLITALAGGDGKSKTNATPSLAACKWNSLKPSPAAPDPSATATASESPSPLPTEIKDVGEPPLTGEPREGIEVMTMATNKGTIKINMDLAKAPCTASSFKYLASKNFFNGSHCHRLTTEGIYVLQCGDPSATGRGGPAYQFAEENLPTGKRPAYVAGQVAMANTGQPGSTGSQFFIVYRDSDLPANYTIVGDVVEGMNIVTDVAKAGTDTSKPESTAGDGVPKTTLTFTKVTVSDPMPSPPAPTPSYPTTVPSTPTATASASASKS